MTRRLIEIVGRLPVGDVTRRALGEAMTDWHYEMRRSLGDDVRATIRLLAAITRVVINTPGSAPRNPFRDLGSDIRHSFRRLQHSRLYAAAAIGTLALGIGANTAVFSLFNGIILRALPVKNLDRLAVIATSARAQANEFGVREEEAYAFATAGHLFDGTFTSDPLIGALAITNRVSYRL